MKQKIPMFCCELIFHNLNRPASTLGKWNKPVSISQTFLYKSIAIFYFSAFYLEVKATEIWKYSQHFSEEKQG